MTGSPLDDRSTAREDQRDFEMPASIHFICRGRLNLAVVKHPVYTTGFWAIPQDWADRLVGGMIYLHETKTEPSYFGGRVLEWRPATEADTTDHAGDIIFTIEATLDAKGKSWRGQDHAMAWTSGLIVD